MSNALIKTEGLQKVYEETGEKLVVLNDVNLEIHQGEIIAITGFSGSGKSTLLQLMGGLDQPTQGHIYFDGVDLQSMNSRTLNTVRNEKMGFIFQFHHLLPDFTALENVLLPSGIKNGPASKEQKNRAKELIDYVGLSARLKHYPSELSGGERQRIAVARALMNQPQIIFADEPTGNLDSANSNQLFDLFNTINKEYNTTFVIVTHESDIQSMTHRALDLTRINNI